MIARENGLKKTRRASPEENAQKWGPSRNAPDKSKTALLIIDMICDSSLTTAKNCLKTRTGGEKSGKTKTQSKTSGRSGIYVNDNFGKWHGFRKLLNTASTDGIAVTRSPRFFSRTMKIFVLNPKLPLFIRLRSILCSNISARKRCFNRRCHGHLYFFTANDAYMRDYHLYIPRDCVAANVKKDNEKNLKIWKKFSNRYAPSDEIDFAS